MFYNSFYLILSSTLKNIMYAVFNCLSLSELHYNTIPHWFYFYQYMVKIYDINANKNKDFDD